MGYSQIKRDFEVRGYRTFRGRYFTDIGGDFLEYRIVVGGKKGTFDLTEFCAGEAVITSYKKGRAASLEFTVMRDTEGKFVFFEGDYVKFFAGKNIIFAGFVFSKERNSDHFIKVKVYDQLRYLKNKDTYSYVFKTASDVVMDIVKNFNLKYGQIDNSVYVIASRIEENKSLFDIILNAVDITYKNTGKNFILFDKAGRIYFKNEANLKLPLELSVRDKSVIDFYGRTDIDSDTFSKVKLLWQDKRKDLKSLVTAESEEGMNKFGILQYFEKMSGEYNNFQLKECAESILKEKNRVSSKFSFKCIGLGNGEELIRAGNGIFIDSLDIGEEIINGFKFIDKCIHRFSFNEHIIEMEFRS
ncbi:MAG: hypothetical protein HFE59_10585 [Clostridiales bacterium]|nr:hypothetical protein [Clostridiales bacterium]